jgi:hypothetical protein
MLGVKEMEKKPEDFPRKKKTSLLRLCLSHETFDGKWNSESGFEVWF